MNRISEWCRDAGIPLDSVRYGYGDSRGDEPMLAMAAHGEWVGKSDIEMVPS